MQGASPTHLALIPDSNHMEAQTNSSTFRKQDPTKIKPY